MGSEATRRGALRMQFARLDRPAVVLAALMITT
jgi:hypothetical protein